jgi:DNA replication protein DnaC
MTACSILKRAALAAYSCLYVTFGDIINFVLNAPNDEKYTGRKELAVVDWIVIDEWDSRYLSSLNSKDFHSKIFEEILRARINNKLPTIICTNTNNMTESIPSNFKSSIDSLLNLLEKYEIPSITGDFRKKGIK